ncbi:hypothetical protein [Kingella sp. (in: b-proteobacteria)]|uniref:hypothetical protein n=1 Tax=Kingella sp. (in: b-proteobacteria) TaxID=2020713 RepID=UPI0026DAFCB6|nr:hypothetical protein [Kingella sp. (in: b-proteobacteria)]MDO4658285.1 hypothetical protein [Kingella sp. (in: b-proteobacteria)]
MPTLPNIFRLPNRVTRAKGSLKPNKPSTQNAPPNPQSKQNLSPAHGLPASRRGAD